MTSNCFCKDCKARMEYFGYLLACPKCGTVFGFTKSANEEIDCTGVIGGKIERRT